MLRVVFPAHYQVEINKLRQQLDEAHLAWQKQWKAQQLDYVIENIRFAHDPNWQQKFFSIQSARDGNHPIWRATKMSFGAFVTSI